ncbi:CDP-diacylglycerol--serine O-phosphatidyltransferase [Paenalkalicoccus suaedae]|uniref:CDP-diacylglycerol--serine O-phosphatidyltransferase n=1 Tax=Paenalkalicoccus suaedae TaxID=2592382 RepID=A0A859FEQ3_9BACI|nr:CDP-diacylglycerol--serine O-phosphatidyltransferase [Paenalkalicoccus suaedae]QKS71182.1 CDP-diacylglycerol--serine O-phosphatidyltransferase [Paenalkalicoccus suaedae]
MIRRHIPNTITMGNILFGFLAIGQTATGELQNAAIFILIGMMLDSMDGWSARKLKVESAFGKELDSLADIVTFGVAPAMLMYSSTFLNIGFYGLLIAACFPLFGAYRLARFNIDDDTGDKNYFTGVPITAAGGIIALLTIFNFIIPQAVISAIYMLLCVLMVSRIRVPSLKDIPVPKYSILITLLLVSLIVVTRYNQSIEYSSLIILAILAYISFMIIFILLKRKRLRDATATNEHDM